jgi:hypothetical protein
MLWRQVSRRRLHATRHIVRHTSRGVSHRARLTRRGTRRVAWCTGSRMSDDSVHLDSVPVVIGTDRVRLRARVPPEYPIAALSYPMVPLEYPNRTVGHPRTLRACRTYARVRRRPELPSRPRRARRRSRLTLPTRTRTHPSRCFASTRTRTAGPGAERRQRPEWFRAE